MPIDPHAQQLLKRLQASGRPPLWEQTPAEARVGQANSLRMLDAKDVPIGRIANGELPGPAGPLRYRSYLPLDALDERLPGLVYFHGGGFVLGSLDTHDGYLRLLANASGCRVVSIDYRLAPEHKFPAAIEDAYAATTWVAGHANELGIDGTRLALGGDSAGATLAAVTSQLAAKAARRFIVLQVLLCPGLGPSLETESRRAFAEGPFIDAKSGEWFRNHYLPADADIRDPRITPLWADGLAGLPEAHIHTAECDMMRDDGLAYAERLQKAGVKVRYTCHPGMIHHFYGMASAIPYAAVAIKEIGAAIGGALSR